MMVYNLGIITIKPTWWNPPRPHTFRPLKHRLQKVTAGQPFIGLEISPRCLLSAIMTQTQICITSEKRPYVDKDNSGIKGNLAKGRYVKESRENGSNDSGKAGIIEFPKTKATGIEVVLPS